MRKLKYFMRKHLMEGETDFQGIHHICTIGFLVNTLPFTFSCIGTVNVDSTVKDWSLISKWPLARTDCERLLITDLEISLVGNITFFCFFWNYQLNIPYTSRLLVWTNQNTTNTLHEPIKRHFTLSFRLLFISVQPLSSAVHKERRQFP